MKPFRTLYVLLLVIIALCALASACLAGGIGEAKSSLPDGSPVLLEAVAVTAIFPGYVYVEDTDTSAGIRVDTAKTLTVGNVVNVQGTMETDPLTEERYVAASPDYPQPAGANKLTLRPLRLAGNALVGGDAGYQKGIPGCNGLNTVGLLVTAWGRPVAFQDPIYGGQWFTMTTAEGAQIKVALPDGMKADADVVYAAVTGICSVEKVNGEMTRVVKVRGSADVVCHQSWAEDRLKTMTLDEKIGQLFQIRFSGDVLTDEVRQIIQDKHLGGIIYFQYNGNLDDPARTALLSNSLQAAAMGPDGKGIPLLLSMDQEGGRVTRITGGADFPGNMALGAAGSAEIAQLAGSVFGREIRAVGANMDLAPVLDVNDNPANPVIGVRSFGEQPALVSAMGQAYAAGLHSEGVVATGKHFPGHGDTSTDSHTGLPTVTYDFATLDSVHGRPFKEAIASGLDAIMTAHIVVTCLDPEHPATLSPQVITGYLRGYLKFNGVVMTDSMGMAGVTASYPGDQAAVMAIKAGVDLLSLPPDLDLAWNAVKAAAESGDIPMARIDQSVLRILRLKHKYGLFSRAPANASAASSIVGCPAHKDAELRAARAGVTLVQNTDGVLPLHLGADKKVLLVAVQSAETTSDAADRFAACIAGKHANTQTMAISENPSSSSRTAVKTAAAAADVVIIATSRAQMYSGQATLVTQLAATGKPVIAVGMREPYELASFSSVPAYLAIYNYRSCGFQAAADVIFGDAAPTAHLPVSIPGLYDFGWGMGY